METPQTGPFLLLTMPFHTRSHTRLHSELDFLASLIKSVLNKLSTGFCGALAIQIFTHAHNYCVKWCLNAMSVGVSTRYMVCLNAIHGQTHLNFSSMNTLRVKLVKDFSEEVPDSLSFGVRYSDGKHQMSLFNRDNLGTMYDKHKLGGEVMVWCDARCKDSVLVESDTMILIQAYLSIRKKKNN